MAVSDANPNSSNNTDNARILIVDDSSTVRSIVCKYLDTEYDTLQASNGEEAWQLLKEHDDISLIFADLHMPVMNGMQLLQQIRESDNPQLSGLPVIMLTGHEDSEAAKHASFNMGATDFISKPFTRLDIRSRVRSYMQFKQNITALEQHVTTDILTGLANEQGFRQQAEKAYTHNERHGYDLSIIRLRMVNYADVLGEQGQAIADKTVSIIARRLAESLRKEEKLAHFGNGQFAILLPMTKAFKSHIISMRLKAQLDNLIFQLSNLQLKAKVAIGMHSTESDHNASFDELMKRTEQALDFSEQQRSSNIVRYDEINLAEEEEIAVVHAIETRSDEPDLVSQLDANDMAKYFAAILAGEFDKIADAHLQALIEPHRAFVRYAALRTQEQASGISAA